MFCHNFCTKNIRQNTGIRLFVTLGFTQRYKHIALLGLDPITKISTLWFFNFLLLVHDKELKNNDI